MFVLTEQFETTGTLHQQSVGAEGLKNVLKLRRNGSAASNISSVASYCVAILCLLFQILFVASLKRMSSLCFDEKLFVQSLYKVLVSISETAPIILYIRDVERLVLQSPRTNQAQPPVLFVSGDELQHAGATCSSICPHHRRASLSPFMPTQFWLTYLLSGAAIISSSQCFQCFLSLHYLFSFAAASCCNVIVILLREYDYGLCFTRVELSDLLRALLAEIFAAVLSPSGINYEVLALMAIKNELNDPHSVLENWDRECLVRTCLILYLLELKTLLTYNLCCQLNVIIILAREYLKDVSISREQLKYLVFEALRGGCQNILSLEGAALEGRDKVYVDDLKKAVELVILLRSINEEEEQEDENDKENEQQQEQLPEEFIFDAEDGLVDEKLLFFA
ncbi:hypothetical protein HN51_022756 [Arachis hypogaea]